MKKPSLTLLFLLGLTNLIFGQNISSAKMQAIEGMFSNIPRKTNTIILKVANAESSELLKHIKLTLADINIYPESVDTDLGLINTQDVSKKTGLAKYSIRVVKVDSTMQVRFVGYFKSGLELNIGYVTAKDDWSRITKRGMEGSLYLDNFNYMTDIVKDLAVNLSVKGVEFIDDTQSTKSESKRESNKSLDPIYN